MDAIEKVALEVPAIAIVCLLIFMLGKLLITKIVEAVKLFIVKWRESEDDRNQILAKGFSDITSHLGAQSNQLARLDEKLDLALEAPSIDPSKRLRIVETRKPNGGDNGSG